MNYRRAIGTTALIFALIAIPATSYFINRRAGYNAAAEPAVAFFAFYVFVAHRLRSRVIGGSIVALLICRICMSGPDINGPYPVEELVVLIGAVTVGALIGWIAEDSKSPADNGDDSTA